MIKLTSLIVVLLTTVPNLFSQLNFNDYKTLKSVGEIPVDFSSLTYKKIEKDLKKGKENLSKSQEKIFFEGIHYGIDDILHSGMVIYGDEISTYVKEVAHKLIGSNHELYNKLRFYTLKSNETNAFSTDQGIIFVTTGLVAQLANEAQLAFVLAHEISHYTSNHVVESFQFKINDRNNNIRNLSVYSKDKEFEADKLGVKLFAEAGYAADELISSFDVLMYSYLPFDEVEIPENYFSNSTFFIPNNLFPNRKYEIKANEDYDDSERSHPNIKKRKEAVEKEINKINNWNSNKNFLGQEKFEYIRNICRFESIRTDILDANFADAIYSIFLLESKYPNSIYLKRMKAQAWLGILQFNNKGGVKKASTDVDNLEGEIATVYFLLKKMSNEGVYTYALRQVYDLHKNNPEDKHIKEVYHFLVKELTAIKGLNLELYSLKSFSEAAFEFNNLKEKETKTDSLEITSKVSKYDKIKNKKNANNFENFDSTKYYLYGISDILKDNEFMQLFKFEANELALSTIQDLDKLSEKKKSKIIKEEENNKLKIGLNELIVVEPLVFSEKKDKLNLEKSEKLKFVFTEAINDAAIEAGLKINTIGTESLVNKGTEIFNQRNVLYNFMSQVANEEKLNVFPVDYDLLNDLKNQYGTSKVLFTWVNHNYSPNVDNLYYAFLFVPPVYPALMIYFPIGYLTGHKTNVNLVVLDIDNGKIELATSYFCKDTPKKYHLGAHIYNVFMKMKQNKSSK